MVQHKWPILAWRFWFWSWGVVRNGSTVLLWTSQVVSLVYFKEKVICLLPVSSFFDNFFCVKVQESSLYGCNGFSRILYGDYILLVLCLWIGLLIFSLQLVNLSLSFVDHLVWMGISWMLMSIAMGMIRRIEGANNWFTKVNILVHMFLLSSHLWFWGYTINKLCGEGSTRNL